MPKIDVVSAAGKKVGTRDLSAEVFEAMTATPTVVPHLHFPLQSGSDPILAAMHRGYTAERYLARLAEADAFAALGLSRRDALWAAEALAPGPALPLFAGDIEGDGDDVDSVEHMRLEELRLEEHESAY